MPYDKAYEPGFEDMMRRVPSVEKLHALTGFRPQTNLADIIDRVSSLSARERSRQPATRGFSVCRPESNSFET